jgi:hypothetical protein
MTTRGKYGNAATGTSQSAGIGGIAIHCSTDWAMAIFPPSLQA